MITQEVRTNDREKNPDLVEFESPILSQFSCSAAPNHWCLGVGNKVQDTQPSIFIRQEWLALGILGCNIWDFCVNEPRGLLCEALSESPEAWVWLWSFLAGVCCCEHVMSDKEENNANLRSLGENSREKKVSGFYEWI